MASAIEYTKEVRPFLEKYCTECHGTDEKKGGISFSEFRDQKGFLANANLVESTQSVLDENEMPPKSSKVKPSKEERAAIVTWLNQSLASIRNASPNDPGVVVMPRLNHREYQRVAASLTGQEYNLSTFLVPDGGAGEGFLNVGQAQQMQTAQFEGFLAAGKALVEYCIPSPTEGFYWSPTPQPSPGTQPLLLEGIKKFHAESMDRLLNQIWQEHQNWLKGTKMPLGIYFEACWRYKFRHELGLGNASFADIAKTFESPLFASSIERFWALLNWKELPVEPVKPKSSPRADSDYQATVLNRTAGPREFVEQNYLLQYYFQQWHALMPPNGKILTQRRDECKKINDLIYKMLGGPEKLSIASKTRQSKNIVERDFRGGFEGTEYYHIDLSLIKGDYFYLMVSDCMDGNDGDYVIWEGGEVIFGKGKGAPTKPWQEVFTQITDLQGNPVSWGVDGKREKISPNAIGVLAPSVLKVKVPEEARQAELNCQVTLDPRWGLNASTQNEIGLAPSKDPHWLSGRRVLGKFKSKKAAIVDGATAIFRDTFIVPQYRALGTTTNEEEDWLENINKDASQFQTLTKEQALSLNIPWPLQYNVAFYRTWPMQFNFSEDYVPLMTPSQKEEYHRLNKLLISLGSPAGASLTAGLVAAGITQPANGIYPNPEQFRALPAASQNEILNRAKAYQNETAQQRQQAAIHLAAFMRSAWRGEVQPGDVDKIMGFYDRERMGGRHHVDAVRSALLPILIHPRFIYRFMPAKGGEVAPRSDMDIASRLSFMLWDTIPDEELLKVAESGNLHRPEILDKQLQRMLKDPKSVALASEFAGLWLQFSDFRESATPDAKRFGNFTPSLKEAMYQEPIAFFQNIFQTNSPLTDALFGNYTFVNEELAGHYGIPGIKGTELRKAIVSNGTRGGLIGMGSVLTKFSTPLRTSPVRRGHWIYEAVLGIHLPPPPPNVPEISGDERNDAGLSVRAQLEQHRSNPNCFSCHERFDPLGVALENYNPIGIWREKDLAGTPVDNQGKFIAKSRTLDGVKGLREYLRENEDKFVKTFCRKLLGYALGRPVEVTDQALLDVLVTTMKENENRPLPVLYKIITSPQFLQQRNELKSQKTAMLR